jgi:hypothetical protein
MNARQDQTRSFVQAELSEFSKEISQGYHQPVRKFIKDMLMGICGTGEPSLHNIAKFIQDKTSTKKTSERLSRNIRTRNQTEISLVVVRKYRDGSRKGKDFYLLCDFEDAHMPEQELITRAIDGYWIPQTDHLQKVR